MKKNIKRLLLSILLSFTIIVSLGVVISAILPNFRPLPPQITFRRANSTGYGWSPYYFTDQTLIAIGIDSEPDPPIYNGRHVVFTQDKLLTVETWINNMTHLTAAQKEQHIAMMRKIFYYGYGGPGELAAMSNTITGVGDYTKWRGEIIGGGSYQDLRNKSGPIASYHRTHYWAVKYVESFYQYGGDVGNYNENGYSYNTFINDITALPDPPAYFRVYILPPWVAVAGPETTTALPPGPLVTMAFIHQNYGNIRIDKKDSFGYNLSGAVFGIYDTQADAQANTNVLATITTQYASGSSSNLIKDLPTWSENSGYTYYVKEISAPANHIIDSNIYTVNVKPSHTTTNPAVVTSTNQATGTVRLNVTPSAQSPFPGATVQGNQYSFYTDAAMTVPLKDINNVDVVITTNSSGVAETPTFKIPQNSRVYIKHTTASSGYRISQNAISNPFYVNKGLCTFNISVYPKETLNTWINMELLPYTHPYFNEWANSLALYDLLAQDVKVEFFNDDTTPLNQTQIINWQMSQDIQINALENPIKYKVIQVPSSGYTEQSIPQGQYTTISPTNGVLMGNASQQNPYKIYLQPISNNFTFKLDHTGGQASDMMSGATYSIKYYDSYFTTYAEAQNKTPITQETFTATGSTVTDLNYSTAQGTWEYNQDNTITYPIGTIVIEEVSVPSGVIANPNNKFIYNHTYDGHGWTDFGTLYDMNGNVVQHNVNLSSTVDITFPMNNQLQQVPVRITLNDVYNSNADFEGAVLEILDHNDQSLYTYILQSGEDFTQTQIYAIPSATAGVRASAILGQIGPGMPPTVKWQLKDSNDILMPFEATPEAWVQTTNLVGELPLWDITIDILSYNYYLTPQATLQRQPILNETTFEYDLYKVLDDGVIVEDFIQTVAADSDGNIIFNTVAIPYENTGNTKYEIRPKAVQFPNLSYDLTPIEITVEQTSPNVMTVTYSKDTFVATVIPILPITGTKQTVYTITCLISLLAIGIYLTKK